MRLVKKIKNISIKEEKNFTNKIKCYSDEIQIDCNDLAEHLDFQEEKPYVGVPAPTVLPDDPWFGSAPKSQKAIQYEEKVATESKIKEEQRKETTQESKNIHQVMYEMATKNWNTLKETQGGTQGGSENFQENHNHNGWNSGTGMGQYR